MTKRKATTKTLKKRLPDKMHEHKFKPGNKAAVGHGRPRTLGELREMVQAIGAEPIQGANLTRLELLVRGMYASRNASDRSTLLGYGWGSVPRDLNLRDWRSEAIQGIRDRTLTPQALRANLRLTDEEIALLYEEAGLPFEGDDLN